MMTGRLVCSIRRMMPVRRSLRRSSVARPVRGVGGVLESGHQGAHALVRDAGRGERGGGEGAGEDHDLGSPNLRAGCHTQRGNAGRGEPVRRCGGSG